MPTVVELWAIVGLLEQLDEVAECMDEHDVVECRYQATCAHIGECLEGIDAWAFEGEYPLDEVIAQYEASPAGRVTIADMRDLLGDAIPIHWDGLIEFLEDPDDVEA